ncbi:GMC family oxidoreductase N-terminal domain-containing protein [Mangrovibacterium lignilyticum]|uniref:GMC family oxidoreductase N-terminal domain-containing protein n=1 Tax=Mangrovibacterium lignilyticum TaxID=2668052 RepID=UPI0013D1E8D3|nr:GMC family oxidoreductase [Mangrovibacterium lignilyticum]
MKKLSRPLTQLKPEYDVVVIGSGYGGSIAASRMARAGYSVCLLEKGKEFLPGEFPSSLLEARKEIQVKKDNLQIGAENGLYEFVAGKEISVFKGCGLGGTSLVNANVSIEAEERVFDDPVWPKELRKDMDGVKQGIEKAREMLQPNPYPEGKNGYPVLKKSLGMRKSAEALGEAYRLLDINVNFENKINQVGVEQRRCNNCGDCVTGCNHTAKNTTHMNYLPDACNHGADIFCEAGVHHIAKTTGGWLVYFNVFDTGRQRFDAPPLFVKGAKVIVSAGSLGSTEILMRSAKEGLELSPMLGKHFTGNGDVLGFGYNNDEPIHGIGLGDKSKEDEIANVGPCITSVVDMRHKDKLEDGMTLEEGTIPAPLRSILIPAFIPLSRLIGKDTDSGFGDFIRERWREVLSFFGGSFRGAMDHTQVYLVMTHDDGEGEMKLSKHAVSISWKGVGKQKIFEKVNEKLETATKALGGWFVNNPSWTKLLDYDLVTVHPLGGCVMGDNAASGVVDHKGQVFAGSSGMKRHKGLYVMDGAILPRSVGTNPLLTISGLAERNAKIILGEDQKTVSYDFPKVKPLLEEPRTIGVQFTEAMTGYFSNKVTDDYDRAYEKGVVDNSEFRFILTIRSENTDLFIDDPAHTAGMFGTVEAPALSAAPLSVSGGMFNLFIPDPAIPKRKEMRYYMVMNSVEGKQFYLEGFKEIKQDEGFDMWHDTTVLYITVYNGPEKSDKIIGKGKLKIKPTDFAKQITTMQGINERNTGEGLRSLTKFGKFFAGNLWDTYAKDR